VFHFILFILLGPLVGLFVRVLCAEDEEEEEESKVATTHSMSTVTRHPGHPSTAACCCVRIAGALAPSPEINGKNRPDLTL
jgi:hypothetical protein